MARLTGFDHLYLEDGYFLGFGVIDGTLQLRALFALTRDHPLYAPPREGEQHCYHEGAICVTGFNPLDLCGADRPSVLRDPDGSLDLGSIAVEAAAESYRIMTDWFDMRFEATSVTATLHSNVR